MYVNRSNLHEVTFTLTDTQYVYREEMRKILSIVLVFSLSVWPLMAQVLPTPVFEPAIDPVDDPPPPQSLFNYEASNGFVITVIDHDDHRDVIGTDRYAESVTMHIAMSLSTNPRIETRIGDATVRSQHLSDSTVEWIEFETPDIVLRHNVLAEQLAWAKQEATGIVSDVPLELRTDTRVYQELAVYGRSLASDGFWLDYVFAGNEFEANFEILPAGCGIACAGCIISLVTVGLAMSALIAACGATWGAGCWATFIGFQLGKGAVVLGCTGCISCLSKKPKNKEGDDSDGSVGRPITF
jgi:hypothetical protein